METETESIEKGVFDDMQNEPKSDWNDIIGVIVGVAIILFAIYGLFCVTRYFLNLIVNREQISDITPGQGYFTYGSDDHMFDVSDRLLALEEQVMAEKCERKGGTFSPRIYDYSTSTSAYQIFPQKCTIGKTEYLSDNRDRLLWVSNTQKTF